MMSARADRAPQRGARSLLSDDDVDLPKLLCGFCAGDFGEGQVVIARGCQLVGVMGTTMFGNTPRDGDPAGPQEAV